MWMPSVYNGVIKRVLFCDLCHETLCATQFTKGCTGTSQEIEPVVALVCFEKHNSDSIKLSRSSSISFCHHTCKIWRPQSQSPFLENFAWRFAKISTAELQTWDFLQALLQIQVPSSPTSCILLWYLNGCILYWRDQKVSGSPEIERKELYALHWMT